MDFQNPLQSYYFFLNCASPCAFFPAFYLQIFPNSMCFYAWDTIKGLFSAI